MERFDYQATFHRCGETLPTKIEDWFFAGASIKEGDDGPFVFARWKRRMPEQEQMGWQDDGSYSMVDDLAERDVKPENVQRLARFIGLDLVGVPEPAHKALVQLELGLPMPAPMRS